MNTPPAVCPDAITMIVGFEVTSKATYEQRFARPTWPGGASGVTIGVGFDLGYETRTDLDEAFPNLPDETRDRLSRVIGLQGKAARDALAKVSDIVVPWDDAMAAFGIALRRYAAMAAKAFPGSERLPPECFGALVSLVYNRGTAMDGQRREEMRRIHDLIATGNHAEVPAQFRAMKRLWPDMKGLRDRRETEAALWEDGLKAD